MAMQQGRASSRRTTRLACKPFRSLADCGSTPTVVGRGPVVGRTLVSSGPDAAFAIFLTRFANQVHKVFFGPLPSHYRCGTRLSRLPGCRRYILSQPAHVKSLADVADERVEGLPVRGAVEAI